MANSELICTSYRLHIDFISTNNNNNNNNNNNLTKKTHGFGYSHPKVIF